MSLHQKLKISFSIDGTSCDLSSSSLSSVQVNELNKETRLKKLDLSNNHIASLPKNFISISHITWLDLSNNQLTFLPENFGSLIKLKHLDLYNNKLKLLPLSFGDLKNLKWLDLKNNSLQNELKKVAGDCLNTKQCELCASQVVTFMKEMKKKVFEEKEKLKSKTEVIETQQVKKRKTEKEKEKLEKKKKRDKEKIKENGVKAKTKPLKNTTINEQSNKNFKLSTTCYFLLIFIFLFLLIFLFFYYYQNQTLVSFWDQLYLFFAYIINFIFQIQFGQLTKDFILVFKQFFNKLSSKN